MLIILAQDYCMLQDKGTQALQGQGLTPKTLKKVLFSPSGLTVYLKGAMRLMGHLSPALLQKAGAPFGAVRSYLSEGEMKEKNMKSRRLKRKISISIYYQQQNGREHECTQVTVT